MQRFAFLPATTPFALAHRGGNEVAPENTMAAFEHAVSLGIDHLETDVHLTSDRVLVAFHDGDLERLAGLGGNIADHTWHELAEIDLGGSASIPTMASLFEKFPTARFNIDPKDDSSVDPLADLIRDHEAIDRVCIGAFSDHRIARLSAALGPRLCTSAGPKHSGVMWAAAQAGRVVSAARSATIVKRIADQHGCLQVPSVIRGVRVVDTPFIEIAHDHGLQVHVWTINDETEMTTLLDAGVDGIISDRLSVLCEVLANRREC